MTDSNDTKLSPLHREARCCVFCAAPAELCAASAKGYPLPVCTVDALLLEHLGTPILRPIGDLDGLVAVLVAQDHLARGEA